MKRMATNKRWLLCIVLTAGGCGEIPDIVIETARTRAIDALEDTVGLAVDHVIDGMVGELFDLDDVGFPFDDQAQEEVEEGFDDDTADTDESDRGGRRGFGMPNPLR